MHAEHRISFRSDDQTQDESLHMLAHELWAMSVGPSPAGGAVEAIAQRLKDYLTARGWPVN